MPTLAAIRPLQNPRWISRLFSPLRARSNRRLLAFSTQRRALEHGIDLKLIPVLKGWPTFERRLRALIMLRRDRFAASAFELTVFSHARVKHVPSLPFRLRKIVTHKRRETRRETRRANVVHTRDMCVRHERKYRRKVTFLRVNSRGEPVCARKTPRRRKLDCSEFRQFDVSGGEEDGGVARVHHFRIEDESKMKKTLYHSGSTEMRQSSTTVCSTFSL